ncbi:ester cyclase [Actinoplanes sp. M2I2]|uniref:ester cyclase n=1 Tax=Actinoplanes sp. M2I2 TaxID=1734444 RepID=UPI00202031D5|nr:ester cyclase [Actinoplanes sp. M2I2]
MTLDLERLMSLWDVPPGPDAEAEFAGLYADPFVLNGASTPVSALVAMSRGLHAAVAGQRREILDVLTAGPDRVAVAFVVRGRHVGPLPSRLGTVPPTGRDVEMSVIDLFTLSGGRITEVRAVSDELGMLIGLGAAGPGTQP